MAGRNGLPTGSGYVVSTLWSAVWVVERATSLSQALRNAVSLGNDTDTVACVAGGLAGLKFGSDPLSEGWWRQMELRCSA
jgi:ADP-ribosylglycohydrolase